MSGERASVLIVLMLVVVAMMPFVTVILPGEVSARTTHAPINIMGNDDFTEENGVSDGDGTPEDPYIIEGWEMDPGYIEIWSTDASFVIRDVAITTNDGVSAIYLFDASNFSISESVLDGDGDGVTVVYGHDFTIEANTISCGSADSSADDMLYVSFCEDFEVRDNLLSNNGTFGARQCSEFAFTGNEASDSCLTLRGCTNASITDNKVAKGVDLQGTSLEHFDSYEMSGNTASGNYQILYFLDEDSKSLSGATLGQVIVVNCSDVVISRVNFNGASGVCVYFSETVTVVNCSISKATTGVVVQNCGAVVVERCFIGEADFGVRADIVETLSVSNCIFDECHTCVRLYAEDAVVRSNLIRDSYSAIGIEMIFTAEIYSNNFVNLTAPLLYYNPSSTFDDVFWNKDYPTGGNYWDVYNGTDEYSGPDQDLMGSDGFGDTAYETGIVVDNYPLMTPFVDDFGPGSEDVVELESYDWTPVILALAAIAAIACVMIVLYAMKRKRR